MVRRGSVAWLLVVLAGCPSGGDEGPPPYEQPAPWEELDPGEREEFMERLFMPVMEEHFAEFDAARWPFLACATCHGADGEAQGWAMPSDAVSPIGLADVPVEEIEDAERRALGIWMDEVVLPEMGRLFEQELTLEGASCLDCHPFDSTLPGR